MKLLPNSFTRIMLHELYQLDFDLKHLYELSYSMNSIYKVIKAFTMISLSGTNQSLVIMYGK